MIVRFVNGEFLRALMVALLLANSISPGYAQVATESAAVSRHPLEIRALKDPEGVLRELPGLLQSATASNDYKEQALLHLAQSNACRVIADWPCQSGAASRAQSAAVLAKLPELQARGMIAESRGRMAMQDFSRAAKILSEAERVLKLHPSPDLTADVYLAYSSLSYAVGKHAVAAEYAERGLAALVGRESLAIRIRLLRNQARAYAQLGDTARAQAVLKEALVLVEKVQDPKLSAELYQEVARIARIEGDVPAQIANGRRILVFAAQLKNSQLTGLAHEVLGLAALRQGDNAAAERELRLAHASFRELKLERDERRALRALIRSLLGRGGPRAELEVLMARSVSLEASLESEDRAMAADDFEARLKFAQQEFEVQRLEAAAALAAQREAALAEQQRLTLMVAVLSLGLLVVLGGFLAARLRAQKALSLSESRMRSVTDNIPAMIARIDMEQRYTYANAALGRALGLDPASIIGRTAREVRGEKVYAEVKPHIEAALRGETTSFEVSGEVDGKMYHFQSNLVPDRDVTGKMQGLFALTFDITKLKLAEAKLERMARMDSLSNVANRRYFEERLSAAFARSRRNGTPLALLCLDIDHFKSINDNHGHAVGDEVIIAFARRLQACVREDDLVARLGGDEFVMLIENPSPDSGENVARKLLATMREPVLVDALTLQVSASIGVAQSADAPSAKALLDRADKALYSAKAAGRNTYRTAPDAVNV